MQFRRWLLPAILACVLPACPDYDHLDRGTSEGEPDAGILPADAGMAAPDAGAPDAGVTPPDAGPTAEPERCDGVDNDLDGLVDEGPDNELFACARECDSDFFASPPYYEEFSSQSVFGANWYVGYAAPALSEGYLVFGPYAETPDWWNKYGWASTNDTSFGDVLLCTSLRLNPAGPRQDELSIFVRHDNDKLVSLAIDHVPAQASLSTRLSAQNNQWIQHATAPFATPAGTEQIVDVVVLAHGTHFVAELKNHTTGADVVLAGDSPDAPPKGDVGFVGWELDHAVGIDRVFVGPPSKRAADILGTH